MYMLTEPYGLDYITHCEEEGFHTHPKEPPLYEVMMNEWRACKDAYLLAFVASMTKIFLKLTINARQKYDSTINLLHNACYIMFNCFYVLSSKDSS